MNRQQKQFGERLRQLRKKEGISGEVLSKQLHMNRHSISSYETGAVEPKMSSLITLSHHFGVTLDYLCGMSNVPQPTESETKLESDAEVFRQIREMCDEQIYKKRERFRNENFG